MYLLSMSVENLENSTIQKIQLFKGITLSLIIGTFLTGILSKLTKTLRVKEKISLSVNAMKTSRIDKPWNIVCLVFNQMHWPLDR